jgi:lysophospholipase L1-like esterase
VAIVFAAMLTVIGSAQPVWANQDTKAIVFIGDSLMSDHGKASGQTSLNTVQITADKLGSDYHTINKSEGGYSTWDWVDDKKGSFSSALADASSSGARVAAVMLGTNDSLHIVKTSPANYKLNLQNLVDRLTTSGIQKVVISNPPWVTNQAAKQRSRTLLQSYRDVVDELAREMPTVYRGFDAYGATENRPDMFNKDGVHFSDAGYNLAGSSWALTLKSILATSQAANQAESAKPESKVVGLGDFALIWSAATLTTMAALVIGFALGRSSARRTAKKPKKTAAKNK